MTKQEELQCENWWKAKPPQYDLFLRSKDVVMVTQEFINEISNRIDEMSIELAELRRWRQGFGSN